ncbi:MULTISPECIES: hypothetical protein [unclassified Corynebacterium]|nr:MULTISPECIES: hypothetical protein [unclassified Corynebacterium]
MTHRAYPRHRIPRRRRDPFTTILVTAVILGVIAYAMMWALGVV